jgi:hypothetical protein
VQLQHRARREGHLGLERPGARQAAPRRRALRVALDCRRELKAEEAARCCLGWSWRGKWWRCGGVRWLGGRSRSMMVMMRACRLCLRVAHFFFLALGLGGRASMGRVKGSRSRGAGAMQLVTQRSTRDLQRSQHRFHLEILIVLLKVLIIR